MEHLEAELSRIDSRLFQYVKRLYDDVVSVAALKTLSAKQLQENHGLPSKPAATIAAAYLPQEYATCITAAKLTVGALANERMTVDILTKAGVDQNAAISILTKFQTGGSEDVRNDIKQVSAGVDQLSTGVDQLKERVASILDIIPEPLSTSHARLHTPLLNLEIHLALSLLEAPIAPPTLVIRPALLTVENLEEAFHSYFFMAMHTPCKAMQTLRAGALMVKSVLLWIGGEMES